MNDTEGPGSQSPEPYSQITISRLYLARLRMMVN